MKALDFEEAMGQIDDKIILEVVSTMNNESKIRQKRKVFRTILIAAVLVSMFTAAAYAIALNIMKLRDVTGESIEGAWNGQHITLNSANLELSFDVTCDPCYDAEFKANWLPMEPQNPYSPNRDGWYNYLCNTGEDVNGELPYVVQLHNGANLKDKRFYLNGKMEILKEDEWNGWQRTEITGDYTDFMPKESTAMFTRNYLLLFSEENGYMVYIASSQYGFDVLERIAENLEVEILDTVATSLESSTEVCYWDLGRS